MLRSLYLQRRFYRVSTSSARDQSSAILRIVESSNVDHLTLAWR
ncbi:MAG TPA: hypothetical protein VM848_06130 [Acidimicrobiia bacterium]|nr:hypothetical protein [Acidimicrobiia bacterium]